MMVLHTSCRNKNITMQYNTQQYSIVQQVQHSAFGAQYSTVQYSAMRCRLVQHSTVRQSAGFHCTTPHRATQCSTVRYSTGPRVQYAEHRLMTVPVVCSFKGQATDHVGTVPIVEVTAAVDIGDDIVCASDHAIFSKPAPKPQGKKRLWLATTEST